MSDRQILARLLRVVRRTTQPRTWQRRAMREAMEQDARALARWYGEGVR